MSLPLEKKQEKTKHADKIRCNMAFSVAAMAVCQKCSPVSSVPSVCVNGCCCTSPVTTTTSLPTTDIGVYGYCYNGERSMMRCSSRMECSNGQTCVNGLCCKTTGDEWQNACAGLTAIASCTNGTCGSFFCTTSNYCCECQYGRTSGLCKDVTQKMTFHPQYMPS
nr:Hypothetical protein CBG08398 [Haemonchus contortus]